MKNIIKLMTILSLVIFSQTNGKSQISIPYGNDGILHRDTSKVDFRFELQGNEWDCRYISYIFLNGTGDIGGNGEENAVRRAMDSWSEITNLDFIEACNEDEADIRISWQEGDHGDPCPIPEDCFFDGGNGTLAHGFFPPPNLGDFAGDIHFDDAEDWSLIDDIDMETVALHELGHALGLRHSDINNSVMEAVYEGERRNLTQDDIDGIRAIYGNRIHPIIGSDIICEREEYALDDFDCLGDEYTVAWEVSNNLSIIQGQGTGNVLIEFIGACDESGFIRVTVNNGCDQLEFTKNVRNDNLLIDAWPTTMCVRDRGEAFLHSECNFEDVSWNFYGAISGYGGTIKARYNANYVGWGWVCATITRVCGTVEKCVEIEVESCDVWPRGWFRISPNPASNQISIEILDDFYIQDAVYKGTILNTEGLTIYEFEDSQQFKQVSLKNLNTGKYFVKLEYRGNVGSQQFIKIN